MKPLVLWCRWNNAKLRLRGRTDAEVWGEIVFPENLESFRFDIASAKLRLGKEYPFRYLMLDEMGVEITTNLEP